MSDSLKSHYGTPDPEYLALLKTLPSGEYPLDSPEAGRQATRHLVPLLRKDLEPELPDESRYTFTDHSVPVAGGPAAVLVRTITPTSVDPNQTFPVLYYIHGGLFVIGSIDVADYKMRALSVDLQVVIVMIEYRLAPEHPHPIPLNDCYDGLKWIVENAASIHADVSKGFIVAGDSAGGNLSAVVAHRARDDQFFQGRQLTGQVLDIPCVVDPRAYPEKYKTELRSLYAKDHISGLPQQLVRAMYDTYLQNSPEDPSASPLLYPSHANLPPAVFQICGLDRLRDEGLLYERLLREAGVKTKLTVYPGWPHGFHILHPTLPMTKKFFEDFKVGLVWLLNGAKRE